MGIFSRIASIFSSNAHAALDKMENPEAMINQYLRDMEVQIMNAETALVKQIAAEKQLEQQLAKAVKMSEAREEQALIALQNNDEGLAARAVADKQVWDANRAELEAQLEEARTQRKTFHARLAEMKGEYNKLKTRRASLVARHQYAKSMTQIQRTMSKFGETDGLVANFERMANRVSQMEAEVNARLELNRGTLIDIDEDFRKLSNNAAVDAELARLKARLQPAQ